VERFKAIVFDWDGTVVNTMQHKKHNASAIFAERYGVARKNSFSSYERYSGVSRKELFDLIAKENLGRGLSSIEFNKLSSEFTLRNIDSYKRNTVFDERNREVFIWLTTHGYSLFISSSAVKDEIEELAELLDIKRYFVEILGSSNTFRKGKDHINFIREKYGLTINQIIFVGDEKADMRLSGKLGLMCVGVANGKPKSALEMEFSDYVIPSLPELKDILTSV